MDSNARRKFLRRAAAAIVAGPLAHTAVQPALADAHERVDPDGPQAKALSYVHQSTNADTVCANCGLYSGVAEAAWGPCAIFPGKQVAAAGWCSAWVRQPD